MKFAHIINPVVVSPESDLFVAQPITFETMRRARAFASPAVEVNLFSAQFAEDVSIVPADFSKTPDLTRSILDFGTFAKRRKLPLLVDLLDRLYAASDADYFIYTNADIALMPAFYLTVKALLDRGYDALVINRRTISKEFTRLEELPLLYAQVGEKHPGRDCFVWRRAAYQGWWMENVCIGMDGVGKVLLVNQMATAKNWCEFTDLHATFHLGNDRTWRAGDQDDYRTFNVGELRKVVNYYRAQKSLPKHPIIQRFIERKGI